MEGKKRWLGYMFAFLLFLLPVMGVFMYKRFLPEVEQGIQYLANLLSLPAPQFQLNTTDEVYFMVLGAVLGAIVIASLIYKSLWREVKVDKEYYEGRIKEIKSNSSGTIESIEAEKDRAIADIENKYERELKLHAENINKLEKENNEMLEHVCLCEKMGTIIKFESDMPYQDIVFVLEASHYYKILEERYNLKRIIIKARYGEKTFFISNTKDFWKVKSVDGPNNTITISKLQIHYSQDKQYVAFCAIGEDQTSLCDLHDNPVIFDFFVLEEAPPSYPLEDLEEVPEIPHPADEESESHLPILVQGEEAEDTEEEKEEENPTEGE